MNSMTKFAFAALALFATPLMAQDMADEMPAEEAKTAEAEAPMSEEVETSRELDLSERVRQLEEQIADARMNGFGGKHFTDDTSDPRNGEGRPGWRFSTGDRPNTVDFKIGGYFSTSYRGQFGSDRNAPTTFDAHRFVPQFEFRIHDFVTFNTEIEFEDGGDEIKLEYAELKFNIMPELTAKAGLILIPFGRYNLEHDDPLHDLYDRPFVAYNVIPSAFDQPGIGAEGEFQSGGFGFSYNFAFTQGFSDNFDAIKGSRDARNSFHQDDNSNKALWLRVGVTPDLYELAQLEDLSADFGISINEQTIGAEDYSTSGFGLDWRVRYTPSTLLEGRAAFEFTGEFAKIGIDRPDTAGVNDLDGWYIQGAFQFRPWDDGEWSGWLRDSGYLALTLRFEGNDLNDHTVGSTGADDRDAFTVGFAFRPYFKTVIRTEWKSVSSDGTGAGAEDRFVFSVSTYF